MATNPSADVLSNTSTEAICKLVENDCPTKPSDDFILIFLTYFFVFVPWGLLAYYDMITDRWKSITIIRLHAWAQLLFGIGATMCTLYYIVIQYLGEDYKEMFAAIVVLCVSYFHLARTLWGLQQLDIVDLWVKRSLIYLRKHNYDLQDMNSFQSKLRQSRWTKKLQSLRKRFYRVLRWCDEQFLVFNLAAAMYLNSSVIDNEFFNCDVPFSRILFHNVKDFIAVYRRAFSVGMSERIYNSYPFYAQAMIVPKYFSESCIRCMVPFLAQFGGEWLKHSHAIRKVLRKKKQLNGVLLSNFFDHAQMLTSSCLDQYGVDEKGKSANCSNPWSEILMHREGSQFWARKWSQMQLLPFSRDPRRRREPDSYSRFKSMIRRLVDGLHPVFFELPQKDVEVIENISAFDLENFVMFLHSTDEGVRSIRSRRRPRSVQRDGTRIDFLLSKQLVQIPSDKMDHGRLVFEKLGYDYACLEGDTHSNGEVWKWSEKRVLEFTCHLENLFSIGHDYMKPNEPARAKESSELGYKNYLKLYSLYEDRRHLLRSRVRPRCVYGRWYWKLWGLPSNSPPIMGSEGHDALLLLPSVGSAFQKTEKHATCIRFIGFIMERVRICLAEWADSSTCDDPCSGDPCSGSLDEPNPVVRGEAVAFKGSLKFSRLYESKRYRPDDPGRPDDFLIRLGEGEGEDKEFMWTVNEQIIWECQRHLLDSVCGSESCSGPGDLGLMMLCVLGFPVLSIRTVQSRSDDDEVIFVKPVSPGNSLGLLIEFDGKEVRMMIGILATESTSEEQGRTSGIEFHWPKWIHAFEACMKALYCGYEQKDLEEYSDESSIEELDLEICSCEYSTCDAKRVYLDREKCNKYSWAWDYWKPQQAFKVIPILFDDDRQSDEAGRAESAVPEIPSDGRDDSHHRAPNNHGDPASDGTTEGNSGQAELDVVVIA